MRHAKLPAALLSILPALLPAAACGPVRFDLDRPVLLRAAPAEVPESFVASLRAAIEQLGGTEGAGEGAQPIEVRFERVLTVGGAEVDGGVDRLRNDVIVVSARGAALPPAELRALAAHELGHCLGAVHLPDCRGVNVMAQGCAPESPGYSADDVADVCRNTVGGVCGR